MNSRNLGDMSNTRMATISQAATWCGMGRTTFRRWAIEIGALKLIGPKMPRIDMDKVNEALDALPAVNYSGPGETIDDLYAGSGGMN